jgi:hypothetical protein
MSTSATDALRFLASAGPLGNTTVRNAEADKIMLQTGGNILVCGCLYTIISQRISPGVCRLSLERTN